MSASLDPALLQMVQQHVNKLIADVDKMMFEVDCDRETVTNALQDVAAMSRNWKNVSQLLKLNRLVQMRG